ncbi:MGMT family protein [Listeria ilorinensis]|uniref:MGMT family protein n=1 Tax=Listeria ilorinensis TaxID=2867439 RepID=UPI001EF46A5E|nr:methylated-DNA--[protein]-cysteine S-methyltransferase [Listeria ilorinensis]
MPEQAFVEAVYQAVEQIPKGRVTTYGQIAYMIGRPKNARLVGTVLKKSGHGLNNMPCHRVVNSSGRLVPGWNEQRHLLEQEDVPFKENGHVALRNCFWQGQV